MTAAGERIIGSAREARAQRPIGLDDQINEIIREIELRERTYPKWIEAGRLRQEHADRRLAVMKAALQTLRDLKEARIVPQR